jgi:hypothetical protein
MNRDEIAGIKDDALSIGKRIIWDKHDRRIIRQIIAAVPALCDGLMNGALADQRALADVRLSEENDELIRIRDLLVKALMKATSASEIEVRANPMTTAARHSSLCRWNDDVPNDDGDCRKLVTLEKDGMIWVGIRSWNGAEWFNNGVREQAKVLAWRELPSPAYSDGLISSMSAPTLGGIT